MVREKYPERRADISPAAEANTRKRARISVRDETRQPADNDL